MIVDGEQSWIALLEPDEDHGRCWRVGLIFGRTLIAKWLQWIALARTLAARDAEMMSLLYSASDEWIDAHVVFVEQVLPLDEQDSSGWQIGTRHHTVVLEEMPAYAQPVPRDARYWCGFTAVEVDDDGIFIRFTENLRSDDPAVAPQDPTRHFQTLRLTARELLELAISPN